MKRSRGLARRWLWRIARAGDDGGCVRRYCGVVCEAAIVRPGGDQVGCYRMESRSRPFDGVSQPKGPDIHPRWTSSRGMYRWGFRGKERAGEVGGEDSGESPASGRKGQRLRQEAEGEILVGRQSRCQVQPRRGSDPRLNSCQENKRKHQNKIKKSVVGEDSGMTRRLCVEMRRAWQSGQGEGKLPECTIRYFSQRLVGQWPAESPRDAGALIAGDAQHNAPGLAQAA